MWYFETLSASGKWRPATSPRRPRTAESGGKLYRASSTTRIRGIKKVKKCDRNSTLKGLRFVYGLNDEPVGVVS